MSSKASATTISSTTTPDSTFKRQSSARVLPDNISGDVDESLPSPPGPPSNGNTMMVNYSDKSPPRKSPSFVSERFVTAGNDFTSRSRTSSSQSSILLSWFPSNAQDGLTKNVTTSQTKCDDTTPSINKLAHDDVGGSLSKLKNDQTSMDAAPSLPILDANFGSSNGLAASNISSTGDEATIVAMPSKISIKPHMFVPLDSDSAVQKPIPSSTVMFRGTGSPNSNPISAILATTTEISNSHGGVLTEQPSSAAISGSSAPPVKLERSSSSFIDQFNQSNTKSPVVSPSIVNTGKPVTSPYSPASGSGLSKAFQQLSHVFTFGGKKSKNQQELANTASVDDLTASTNHSKQASVKEPSLLSAEPLQDPSSHELPPKTDSYKVKGYKHQHSVTSLVSLSKASLHEESSHHPTSIPLLNSKSSPANQDVDSAPEASKLDKKKGGFGLPALPSLNLGLSKFMSAGSLKQLAEHGNGSTENLNQPHLQLVELPLPPSKAATACALLPMALIQNLLSSRFSSTNLYQSVTLAQQEIRHKHVIHSLPSRANVLILDMRPAREFSQEHIDGSVCVNLPPIVIKRFRKGAITAFSIDPFLLADTRSHFEAWRKKCDAEPNTPRYVIVYDDDMNEEDSESEAWCMVSVLLLGLADHLYDMSAGRKFSTVDGPQTPSPLSNPNNQKAIVGYVRGGFKEVQLTPSANKLITASFYSPESVPLPPSSMLLAASMAVDSDPLPSVLHSAASSSLPLTSLLINSDASAVPRKLGGRKGSVFSINTTTPPARRARGDTIASIQRPVLRENSNIHVSLGERGGTSYAPASMLTGSHVPDGVLSDISYHSNTPSILYDDQPTSPRLSALDLPTPTEPYSQILPWLYLGSDSLPTGVEASENLRALGITHVLNMANEIKDEEVENDGRFGYKWIRTEDSADHAMDEPLAEAVSFIQNAHKNPDAVVFVHCKAGKSRSVTAVLAWLITHNNMTLKEAYQHVRTKRPEASPNLGFFAVLMRMEQDARRVVTTEQSD
ncbi:hypothetical protein SeLEV6574_g02802 [Synchytrium endobioticum]|nr:hypothetical protein SeLEV6574_g02802 [Synchytrium endobioticum]